jgi:hypothetical protein
MEHQMIEPQLPRLSTEKERNQIKARTHQLFELAGGVEFFAPVTAVKKAALSKYASLGEPDKFIRADVIIELDRQIGAPMMVSMLAGMLGYKLVPMDDGCENAIGHLDIATLAKEAGEAVTAVAIAASSQDASGKLCPAATRSARKEISEAKAALHKIDRKLSGGGR